MSVEEEVEPFDPERDYESVYASEGEGSAYVPSEADEDSEDDVSEYKPSDSDEESVESSDEDSD